MSGDQFGVGAHRTDSFIKENCIKEGAGSACEEGNSLSQRCQISPAAVRRLHPLAASARPAAAASVTWTSSSCFIKTACIKEAQLGTCEEGNISGATAEQESRDLMDAEHPEPLEMVAGPVREPEAEYEEGGDAVCWAHLVCPECGAIVTEGHRAGCEASAAE